MEFYNIYDVHMSKIEHIIGEKIINSMSDGLFIISTLLGLLLKCYLNHFVFLNCVFVFLFCLRIKYSLNKMVQEIEQIKFDLGHCLPIYKNYVSDNDELNILNNESDDDTNNETENITEQLITNTKKTYKRPLVKSFRNKKNKCCHQSSILNIISTSSSDSEVSENSEVSEKSVSTDNISSFESENINK